jgi:hypothetical protein
MADLPHGIEEAAVIRRDHPPHDRTFHFTGPEEQSKQKKRKFEKARRELGWRN